MSFEIEIKMKNMGSNDRLYDYAAKKTEKLSKFLKGISNAKVELTHAKSARQVNDRYVTQITIWGKGFTLRSEERSSDAFVSFDSAIDKIQRRMKRYKGKRFRGRGDGTSIADGAMEAMGMDEDQEEKIGSIIRKKKFTLIPMDEYEAIEQSNLLGHKDFFVFYNMGTNSVNVLYLRRDGNYGLIETEVG